MRKDKLRKVVTILTIIAIIITFFILGLNYLLPMYLSYKFNSEIKSASSIGIIGGADGPTSIYLASKSFSHTLTIIFALLSIVGVLCIILLRRRRK